MAYFSNGCEGETLEIQCRHCPLGDGPCPVQFVQMQYNYVQLDEGQEKLQEAMTALVDDDGICQVRKQLMDVLTIVPKDEQGTTKS